MQKKNKSNTFKDNFRELLNFFSDPIMVLNQEGVVLVANKAVCTFLGVASEELIGKHFEDLKFLDKKTKMLIQSQLKKRMKGEVIENYEIPVLVNSETKYFEPRGNRIEYFGEPADLIIFHDVTERRQLQSQLLVKIAEMDEHCQESEGKYRKLFQESMDAIFVADAETGIILDCNRAASELVGREKSEIIGQHQCILYPKEEIEGELGRGFKQHLSTRGGRSESQVITKNGQIRDVSIKVSLIELNGKKVMQGTFRDITERKKAEQALRKSEKRYRELANSLPEIIFETDLTGKLTFFSQRAFEVTGFTKEEFEGRNMLQFVVPEERERAKENMKKSLTGRKLGFNEYTLIRKNGTTYPTLVRTAPLIFENKVTGLRGLVIDITERKKRDIELNQEKNKMEAVTQSIGAGFVIISKDYHVIWANKFIKEYKGNVEGKLCYATLNDLDHICPDCGVKKVFENGANRDAHEYSSIDIKGNPYWVELIATPIKDENGKVMSAVEIAVDITEKKNLQNKLAQYSQKLEKLVEERTKQLEEAQLRLVKSERLAAIGELAGMVGHDLRNPLTGIENAAYFLKTKGATISEAQAKEMLETIDKCVEHSNKIVSDLFDYSKEIRLELQESSPRNVLSEALDMVQVPAKVEILNLIPDEQHLNVDPDKIERVFINLIKNAIDAMPNGGKITIDSKEANGSLKISFADIGTGISNEILPKIFSPLFTTKAQGMGFGLAICKRIIEAHGGTITVKTAKGKGTTFTVTLPIKREPEIGGEKVWINMPESSLSTMTKA